MRRGRLVTARIDDLGGGAEGADQRWRPMLCAYLYSMALGAGGDISIALAGRAIIIFRGLKRQRHVHVASGGPCYAIGDSRAAHRRPIVA